MTDVVVIGAGVAGLTCATELHRAGRSVVVLEARERIGGRIHTHWPSEMQWPVELGAEFIHGRPKETLDIVHQESLVRVDGADAHYMLEGQRLVNSEKYWERIHDVMTKLNPDAKTDLTFAEFLEKNRKKIPPATAQLARSYVEGFHASDASVIGCAGLAAAEQSDAGAEAASSVSRLLGGYDQIPRLLAHKLSSDTIHLRTVVKSIDWEKNEVSIRALSHSRVKSFNARAVVITVPIGVLRASENFESAIAFHPEPPQLRAIRSHVHMGAVLRFVLQFRSEFWQTPEREPVAFLQASPDTDFPVWWTQEPVHVPFLTAWQGGPRAQTLGRLSVDEQVDRALATLAKILKPWGTARATIDREFVTWHTHDWTNDPFALGAYSYVGAGGLAASRSLARPSENTVYFAGEGTQTGDDRGTVSGAIASGQRAARQILKAAAKV